MSLNGSGVFNVNSAGQPVVAGTLITAAAFNAYTADVAAALSTALYSDGQRVNAANQNMGGYKLTGLAAGSSAGDSVRYEQAAMRDAVQTQDYTKFTAGGLVDAMTGTLAPAIAAYVAGLRVSCIPNLANTIDAPTINLNALGAKTVKKRGTGGTAVPLAPGDYNASGAFDFEYDGTDFILLNPLFSATEAYILVRDEKASGTASGGFTSGAWRTRTLNTEVVDTLGISTLAGNAVNLPAGTYRYRAAAPAHFVNQHKVRLYNVTDAAVVPDSYGMSMFATNTGAAVQNVATTTGRFTIAAAKDIRLEHYCDTTQASNGFGIACSFAGVVEVFAELEFWKEA